METIISSRRSGYNQFDDIYIYGECGFCKEFMMDENDEEHQQHGGDICEKCPLHPKTCCTTDHRNNLFWEIVDMLEDRNLEQVNIPELLNKCRCILEEIKKHESKFSSEY